MEQYINKLLSLSIVMIRKERDYCIECKKHRYFISWYQDYFGWSDTCLKCGNRWITGSRIETHDKHQSIQDAKQVWRTNRNGTAYSKHDEVKMSLKGNLN